MRSHPVSLALLAVVLATSLAACGERGDDPASVVDGTGGSRVATTPQALAWIASATVGTPDAARVSSEFDDAGAGTVAGEVVLDGHGLAVGVVPGALDGPVTCTSDADFFDSCVDLGDGASLGWQEEEPEEDPGVVYLFVEKEDATVVLEQSSTPVTGDPRELDLPFSVDAMLTIARDPRIDLTTTQQAVDEGAAASWWRGPAGEPDGDTVSSEADPGDVPTTPRALAWIATQTLPDPDRASATDDFEEFGKGAIAIEMRYGSDGEYDGDLLALAVSRRLPKEFTGCAADEYSDGCETLEDGVVLQWEEQVPEEDPGTVIVVVPRDEGAVALFQAGQDITGDPRELDLRVSVDEMIALGQDPRVAPTTTQEAVDGGEELPFWVDY